jgi:hypothetical protein
LFVNGVKANLLSTSRFYDENHSVQFCKDECNIYNYTDKWIIKGTGTLDNCRGVSTLTNLSCHKVILDDINLWHLRLGHNFKDLLNISKIKAVHGLLNL